MRRINSTHGAYELRPMVLRRVKAAMRALVTGTSGFVGAALVPRLQADGHEIVGFARDPARVHVDVPVVRGDAVSGQGLEEAMEGVDVADFLIHSMEAAAAAEGFGARDRRAAANFAGAARAAGVRRVVYLGGLVPQDKPVAPHLASRLEVEELLLDAAPEAVALRASIVIGAKSRSFRFLVRLVERVPVMPLPAWRDNRTQPLDQRDMLALLEGAGTSEKVDGPLSLDIGAPDVLTYGEMIERIRDLMLVRRPKVRLGFTMTPVASVVAAAIAGEDHGLIGPLMESLETDLLLRDDR